MKLKLTNQTFCSRFFLTNRSIPKNADFITLDCLGDHDLTVDISVKNGLRHGTYTINGIKGTVPVQAITSVNLQHAKDADIPDFDFGTNILEIIEPEPQRLIDDVKYRQKRIMEMKHDINNNPNKISLLAIKGIKSDFRINHSKNQFLINFQINCGFQLVKVFFKLNKKAKKGNCLEF